MQKIILAILYSFISLNLLAQSIVEGVVVDSISNQSIPYVNIGIVGKNVGTVTDENGEFRLVINEKFNNEKMLISMVGYKSKSFRVIDFIKVIENNNLVSLNEQTYRMSEITVTAKKFKGKKLKEKVVGNSTDYESSKTGFETNLLGNEIGIIVKVKKRPTLLKDLKIHVVENKYDQFKFRINVYDVKGGLPHKNILNENIIVESKIKEGMLTVDLSSYEIIVEDDFFVSVEWIEDMGKYGLSFALDISGTASPSIARATSQGEWKEVGKMAYGTGIGIALTIQY